MGVPGRYLPEFADLEPEAADVALIRNRRFEPHQFDGVAVDIEWRRDVADQETRDLAGFLRAAEETGSFGWSVYDYRTPSPAARELFQRSRRR